MLSVQEALTRICRRARPLTPEMIPLSRGLNRVLAEDLRANTAHPPAAVSAMDGYAIRRIDLRGRQTEFECVGQSVAGGPRFAEEVREGQTVRVFTGARIPDGADWVVPQEDVCRQEDRIAITVTSQAGNFIRPLGFDFQENQLCLRQGDLLTPRRLTLAAAMNIVWLPVYRQPRVAILATGDEIVMPGSPLSADLRINSSGIGLEAFVIGLGALPWLLGTVGDTVADLKRRLRGIDLYDILLITGGVSVGERDVVQEVLSMLGITIEFWKVAIRPGKPFLFGRRKGLSVFGFPGNPVSTLVCASLFLGPLLRRLQGDRLAMTPESALLGVDLSENDSRQAYLRARLTEEQGRLIATPFPLQDSAMVYALSQADCFILRPAAAPPLKAHSEVPILRLSRLGL